MFVTSEEDIEFAKRQTAKPHNCKLFSVFVPMPIYISAILLPDVNMLMQQSCNIVLGTDSLASNDQLNILEEIKTLQKNFHAIPLADIIAMGYHQWCKGLAMDKQAWEVLKKGKNRDWC